MLRRVILVLTALCIAVSASQPPATASIPNCSLPCLENALASVGCLLTDTACQCKNAEKINSLMQQCLLERCTMQEVIEIAKFQAFECNLPQDSRKNYLRIVKITCVSLELFFIGVRLFTKLWIKRSLGWDDWLISISGAISIPSLISMLLGVYHGLGLHIYQFMHSYDFAEALKYFYALQLLYTVSIIFTKCSILVFFKAIFPSRGFSIAANIVIAYIVIMTTVYMFLIAFQCHPIEATWNPDIKPSKCMSLNTISYSGSAISISEDLVTLILPLPLLRTLKIGVYRKIGLGIMLAIGSFGCVASMIRMKFVIEFGISTGKSSDPTYTIVPAIAWSSIESAAAISCACLPTVRVLLRHLFPTIMHQTRRGTGWSSGPSGNPSDNRTSRVPDSQRMGEHISMGSFNKIKEEEEPNDFQPSYSAFAYHPSGQSLMTSGKL